MIYPNWKSANPSNDPLEIKSLSNDICRFQLNKIEVPTKFYKDMIIDYAIKNNDTIITKDPLTYTTSYFGNQFLIQTKFSFCNDETYAVFITCPIQSFDQDTTDKVFNSMQCIKNHTTIKKPNKKVGLIINPKDLTSFKDYNNAFNLARNNHVQVTHHYIQWRDIEKNNNTTNWEIQDYLINTMHDKGFEISAVFNIIHTSVIGKLPNDIKFTSWKDEKLKKRFTNFILKYLERYDKKLNYIQIGNEIDIYFNNHKDELDDYVEFYKHIYNKIKEKYPDLMVGTVFAYHEIKANNNQDIYNRLNIGDFDSFTLYIYDKDFNFNKDPDTYLTYLKEIETLTKNRKYSIEEIGWNTHNNLQSNQQKQAQTVNIFFNYLKDAPNRLEYMMWFMLHDWNKTEATLQAGSFFEKDDNTINNSKFMDPFVDFLTYLGLIKKDGTPKLGWYVFANRTNDYYLN